MKMLLEEKFGGYVIRSGRIAGRLTHPDGDD